MVDAAEVADILCLGYDTRTSKEISQGIYEWQFAETAAYFGFKKDFLSRFKGGYVTGQLDYKSEDTDRFGDPAIQAVIDAMRVHFRNWWSRKNASREGGFRKPDGLGISPNASIIEIMEVKPAKYYRDGVAQLGEVINIIRGSIEDYYKEKSLDSSPMINPNFITVKGTPWKPRGDERVVPLPYSNQNGEISWICFKPNHRVIDLNPPIDGVIIYEIHYISKSQYQPHIDRLPADMKRRLSEAHAARMRSNAMLGPFAQQYAKQNSKDAQQMRELAAAIGIIAAVAVVALVIVYAAPLVIAAAPEVAAVAAEAETVEVLVGGTYRVAPQLVRVAAAEYEIAETSQALVRSSMAR